MSIKIETSEEYEKALENYDKRKIFWDRFLEDNNVPYNTARTFKRYFSKFDHYKKYFMKFHRIDEFIESEPKIYWDMFVPLFHCMSNDTQKMIYSKGLIDIEAKYSYMQKHFNSKPSFIDYVTLFEDAESDEMIEYLLDMIDKEMFLEEYKNIEFIIVANVYNSSYHKKYSTAVRNRLLTMSVNVLSQNKNNFVVNDKNFLLHLKENGYQQFHEERFVISIYDNIINFIKKLI